MEIRPIFFQEILFFDFLEESTSLLIDTAGKSREGKIEEQDFSFPK